MRTAIRSLATLAVLVAAACSDATPTGPAMDPALGKGAAFPMAFTYSSEGLPLAGWSAGGTGAADFGGSMQTPTPCYDLTATNEVGNGRIMVTITAVPTGEGCIQVIASQNYTGQVMGLSPGRYSLRVMHVLGGSRTSAYDGSVTVQ